ncbi:IPT/TIG domain-containing protein [Paractinoplanes maris]|uniref:IPT/TIG domain-containing protein n=1 Tax=Paractinoplanes maris TaxID=1734446 RepID=UPI0020220DFD|nr:IPT/TIG domain-containing protein [Actinoplanes maris]
MTFKVPAEATPGPNGVVKQYRACVYGGDTVNTSSLQPTTNTAGYLFNVGLAPRLNNAAGPSGGTNSLTVTAADTAAIFTGVAAVGAYFSSSTCPTAYGTPGATLVASNVNRLSNTQTSLTVPAAITSTGVGPKSYALCLYNGATAASTLLSSTSYTVGKVYLSNTSGPSAGGNGITITATDATTYSGFTPGILLVSGQPCNATYETTDDTTDPTYLYRVATAKVRKLSDTQVAFTVPTVARVGSWTVCTYNSTNDGGGSVVASADYTTIAAAIPAAIRPSAGPATGGTEIVVSGTDFPTTPGSITATLGGVALENIRPLSAYSFRATTPAHSVQANSPLVVTTSSGVRTLTNAFSFQNEIIVAPRTAPNTIGSLDVKVTGTGFLSYNWPTNPTTYGTSSPTATDSRVYLVRGTYNGAAAVSTDRKANAPVSECWNVLVINDETLVCSLVLDRRFGGAAATAAAGAEAAFPLTYANTTGTGNKPNVTASTTSTVWEVTDGTFSQDDVGQPISDGGTLIAAGTTITAVLSPTRIVVSQVGTGAGGAVTDAVVGGPVRTGVTTLTASSGATSVTSASAVFTQADVGRAFNAFTTGDIADGTVILSVSADGKTAYLNQPTNAVVDASDSGTLRAAAPVPNGAYTLTVVSNAAVGAATSDPAYTQSVVSSGSTFTVAPS